MGVSASGRGCKRLHLGEQGQGRPVGWGASSGRCWARAFKTPPSGPPGSLAPFRLCSDYLTTPCSQRRPGPSKSLRDGGAGPCQADPLARGTSPADLSASVSRWPLSAVVGESWGGLEDAAVDPRACTPPPPAPRTLKMPGYL